MSHITSKRTTEEIATAITEWGTCAVLDPTDADRRTLIVYVDDEHGRDHRDAAARLREQEAEIARLRDLCRRTAEAARSVLKGKPAPLFSLIEQFERDYPAGSQ